jgi:hypothetical protein
MAELRCAADSARLDAGLACLWPKTRSNPAAVSRGIACSVWQARRRREDWTLMTHWRELFDSPPHSKNVRMFAEYELVASDGVKRTQDILVLKQGSLLLWTFRASDLDVGTLSFVRHHHQAPSGNELRTCMLLDVRPMLASMSGEGFSYLVMFDCDREAAVLRNWLQRAWCSQTSDDAPAGQEAGPGWESFLNDASAGSTESDGATAGSPQRESGGLISGGDEDARDSSAALSSVSEDFSALDPCSPDAALHWDD